VLEPTSLTEQLERVAHDPLRILVVGAGIAGVSVAQLLRRVGRHPVLVERSREAAGAGYMLGLLPLADPVIEALGVRGAYLEASAAFDRYRLRGRAGRELRVDDFRAVLHDSGSYRGISRCELLEVLSAHGAPTAFDTTVTGLASLAESAKAVAVTFRSAGQRLEADFDLVVLADGMHSATRGLVLGDREVASLDTGWSGWVAWGAPDDEPDLGEEVWGAGFLVGSYPVRGKLGVIAAGPTSELRDRRRFVEGIRRRLTSDAGARLARALEAVEDADDAYCWPMVDCRCDRWRHGRAVLLGDAAAGFLPTAGVGAGMAMESAGVLARLLLDADAQTWPKALDAYQATQRRRVQIAQDTSRRLARLTFSRSRLLAAIRDRIAARVSVGTALQPIRRLLAASPLRLDNNRLSAAG
jgi:salicylate hydroxylase